MYTLRSLNFNENFGYFDSVSEAIHDASLLGLPCEEFVVLDASDTVMASITTRNNVNEYV